MITTASNTNNILIENNVNICTLCIKNKVCKYKDKVEQINAELQSKIKNLLKYQTDIPPNDTDFPSFSISTRCKYSDYTNGPTVRNGNTCFSSDSATLTNPSSIDIKYTTRSINSGVIKKDIWP